ncbi:MAG: thioredoxin domain-containing protein, partial [Planctomycetia bacterium]|nr:thioredoxin domain-containing protein [Planctomycetia bacterium]
MPNHLATESSPYLLQHQNNPVDWHPWGAEAINRAKKEDKPIFLSIGYAACHWCHVMEHESFENEPIAKYLNEHFISIKVDREERPDLDQIYMNAVQLLTGRGGWPMSVFLTPDLKPFYGGMYWPPTPKMGMPGFEQILVAVNDAWRNRRDGVLRQADELTGYLQTIEQGEEANRPASIALRPEGLSNDDAVQILDNASRALQRSFDSRQGGFGSAPKFPHSMDLQLLLRLHKREPKQNLLEMVTLTLDKMASGGIYDHLAGGFARYSVDERWLIPHFEKMLYDNALLTSAYLDAYLVTRDERFARIVRETCNYILTYMTDTGGGFHSTEDADSEGEEGKFYVWTPAEIKTILGDKAAERFCYVYDVSEAGNFEHGKSILNLPKNLEQCAALKGWDVEQLKKELAASRVKLLAARDQRVRPGKDDKILVSWNALMIDALARAARIVEQPGYAIAAEKAADFILLKMARSDGRLLHTWRNGHAKLDGYLDDYAYFVNALVTLYEATFNERWIEDAVRLADVMLQHFTDKDRGGFFFTADDHEQLIARNKDLHDASVPSGNAMAATALLRLGKLCGKTEYLEAASSTLAAAQPVMERMPTAVGQMLIALDLYLGPSTELVLISGKDETANQSAIAAL